MKPERVIRFGVISAAIFPNEIETDGGTRIIRNVRLQRRYRNGDGDWKTSDSLTLQDLPVAIEVLRRATDFIAAVEADSDG